MRRTEDPVAGAFWSIYVTVDRKPGRLRRYTPDHFESVRDAIDYIGEPPSPTNPWRILYRTTDEEVDDLEHDPAWGENAL